MSGGKGTQTRPAKLQEFPFSHAGLRDAITFPAASHVERVEMICKVLTHYDMLFGLSDSKGTPFVPVPYFGLGSLWPIILRL
ncbi:MAG: hypothetical protein JRI22_15700 [Deltaproteobacteria bacterium]|nr:hypothetical protein [Deltaproteobacteria bacterium]